MNDDPAIRLSWTANALLWAYALLMFHLGLLALCFLVLLSVPHLLVMLACWVFRCSTAFRHAEDSLELIWSCAWHGLDNIGPTIEGVILAREATRAWERADCVDEFRDPESRARLWGIAAHWASETARLKKAPKPDGPERWKGWARTWFDIYIMAWEETQAAWAVHRGGAAERASESMWTATAAHIQNEANDRLKSLDASKRMVAERARVRLDRDRRSLPRRVHITDLDWREQVCEAGVALARTAVERGVAKVSALETLADHEIPEMMRDHYSSVVDVAREVLRAGHLGNGKFDAAKIDAAVISVRKEWGPISTG